ncbi:MAG TPA: deoxyribonuclease IV [Candidatus Thermoplasmatota archaeon]|nr:deoxyribonuclease IV [Candidatus Thermoplasmatota archaeon]
MILGSHVSVAGGPEHAFGHAAEIGCDAIQVFVKPPRKLRGIKDFTPEQIHAWEAARATSKVQAIVVHANYLINLAGQGHTGEYSREALLDEMKRAHELRIGTVIFHPGQHFGGGEEKGLRTIAKNLQWCLKKGKDYGDVTIALENMAGQGTMLGYDLQQLRTIIDLTGEPRRFGVCIDTCHTLAAGYDLQTREGYAKTMELVEALFDDTTAGVRAFHVNDSKTPRGSRVDRHAEITKGTMGAAGFKLLLQDPRWRDAPGVLETPHDDNKGFAKDLKRLRKLEAEPLTDKDLPRQRVLG